MKSAPFFSLRIKIVGTLFLAILPAFLGSWLLTSRQASLALKRQKQQDELVIARNIAAQMEDVLAKARQTVEALAGLPDIRGMDANVQKDGMTLVTQVTELIDGFIAWDLKGRVIATDGAQPDTRRLIPSDPGQLFLKPALASGAAAFSDVYRSRTGDLAVAISVPIRSEGGAVTGVLTGGILLDNHTVGGIEEIRVGKSGYAYVVDGKGQVIVHPQRERLMQDLSLNPPVQEVLESRKEGVTEFTNADGVEVLAAYAPIKTTGWGVVVRQPTSESYAYVARMHDILLSIFVMGSCLALLIGVWLAWRVGQPLHDLAKGVRLVTEGDLSAAVPVQTRDELGELARAFNGMTARLKRHMEETASTERRLARSEKLAAVGQLAAGIAHEIYNPLNIIGGFAEFLLEKTPEGDPRRSALEDIGRETERCRKLVADLLGFARERSPQVKETDLNALAAEAVDLAGPQARPRKVKVRLTTDERLPRMEADPDQIKQVLLNLILNACQAMPEGGTATVETRLEGGRAVLSVKDTGPGLAPESMSRLFTPFFTTKEDGTGLGLALSYAIVERHGGELRADNDPQGGARFTVRLPIKEAVHA